MPLTGAHDSRVPLLQVPVRERQIGRGFRRRWLEALGGAPAAKDAAAKTAKTAPSISSIAAGEQSDHLVRAAAYDGWARAWRDAQLAPGVNARAAAARYAAANGLDPETLRQIAEMRGQYASLLADAGFIMSDTRGGRGLRPVGHAEVGRTPSWGWADASDASRNADAGRAPVVKAVLCAGCTRTSPRSRRTRPRAVRGGATAKVRWGAPRVAEREAGAARGTRRRRTRFWCFTKR